MKKYNLRLFLNVIGLAFLIVGFISCGAQKNPEMDNNNRSSMKTDSSAVVEKYWKLTDIEGTKVVPSDNWVREPFMMLKRQESRMNGNSGCNSFFGTYELKDGNHLKFSQIGATKMACGEMKLEQQIFEALDRTDNYTVNGDTLYLNNAEKTPLARFVAIYMK